MIRKFTKKHLNTLIMILTQRVRELEERIEKLEKKLTER